VFRPSAEQYQGQHWWLVPNEDFAKRYGEFWAKTEHPPVRLLGPAVVVRVRGWLIGPGKYGHIGRWKYQFSVDEVLEMRREAVRELTSEGEPEKDYLPKKFSFSIVTMYTQSLWEWDGKVLKYKHAVGGTHTVKTATPSSHMARKGAGTITSSGARGRASPDYSP